MMVFVVPVTSTVLLAAAPEEFRVNYMCVVWEELMVLYFLWCNKYLIIKYSHCKYVCCQFD